VTIAEAAARAIGSPLAAARRVAGGDINDAWAIELRDGTRAFVKSRAGAIPGEYATEAAGLRWLGEVDGGLAMPAVLAVSDDVNAGSAGRTGGRAALKAK
jgi:fructosamine-3-kinase